MARLPPRPYIKAVIIAANTVRMIGRNLPFMLVVIAISRTRRARRMNWPDYSPGRP